MKIYLFNIYACSLSMSMGSHLPFVYFPLCLLYKALKVRTRLALCKRYGAHFVKIFLYLISFRQKCFPPGTFHYWMIKNTSQKTENEFSGLWYFQIWTKLERNQSLNIKGNGNAKCIALPFDLTVIKNVEYSYFYEFLNNWRFSNVKMFSHGWKC